MFIHSIYRYTRKTNGMVAFYLTWECLLTRETMDCIAKLAMYKEVDQAKCPLGIP